MADNVKLEDMNKEQLTNAVTSLIQQLQQSDATIRDLGAKVANKEIENSRLRTVLEASRPAPAPQEEE
jgi:regulator of replication initiation timing